MPFTNSSLTPRERQVLALIGKGEASREIAHTLGISVWTVGSHRKRICAKLGVHSTAELVALCAGKSGSAAPATRRDGGRLCRVVVNLRNEQGRVYLMISGKLRQTPGVVAVQIGSQTYYF